jgi:DNA helicase IV
MGIDHAGDDIRELSTVTDRHFAAPARATRQQNYDGYAHVLVDEAQDVSPMQWRMLGRRGGQAGWTIVGDAAQSAWPDLGEARRARHEALRGKQVRRFHLTTNYRNSAEIFEFAASLVRRVVPDADLPHAVRRTGAPPDHRTVTPEDLVRTVGEAVARLWTEVDGTIGVITPAHRYASFAAEFGRGEAWVGPDAVGRVHVVDAMRAKGLEYDGVVVVAPEEFGRAEPGEEEQTRVESATGLRVLYVALTRATHRLVTVATSDGWRRRRR